MANVHISPQGKEQLKSAFDISHFDLNAILRGVQLTLVGGPQRPGPEHHRESC